jgi:hypothetical protein
MFYKDKFIIRQPAQDCPFLEWSKYAGWNISRLLELPSW